MSEVAVSVLTVEKENAVSTFYNLETAKVDYFHIDVMDGKFVEKDNLEQMKDYALTLSHITNVSLDVHLMVDNIEKWIDEYTMIGPKIISFHYEAFSDKEKILENINNIKQEGCKAGLAINPETPVEKILDFLPYIHQVLVMTVKPGKGGQKLIPETIEKIKQLYEYREKNGLDYEIEADGGITNENAQILREAGCDRLVSGNYLLKADNYAEAVKKIKGEK